MITVMSSEDIQEDAMEEYLGGSQIEECAQSQGDSTMDYEGYATLAAASPDQVCAESSPRATGETPAHVRHGLDGDPSVNVALLSDSPSRSSHRHSRTTTPRMAGSNDLQAVNLTERTPEVERDPVILSPDSVPAGASIDDVNHREPSPRIKVEDQEDDNAIIASDIGDVIVISDDEDEIAPTVVNEGSAESSNTVQLESNARAINLGNSVLRTRLKNRRPTKEVTEMMKKAQQKLAEQALRKPTDTAVKTSINKSVSAANPRKVTTLEDEEDPNAWMNEEIDDDSDDSVMLVS